MRCGFVPDQELAVLFTPPSIGALREFMCREGDYERRKGAWDVLRSVWFWYLGAYLVREEHKKGIRYKNYKFRRIFELRQGKGVGVGVELVARFGCTTPLLGAIPQSHAGIRVILFCTTARVFDNLYSRMPWPCFSGCTYLRFVGRSGVVWGIESAGVRSVGNFFRKTLPTPVPCVKGVI